MKNLMYLVTKDNESLGIYKGDKLIIQRTGKILINDVIAIPCKKDISKLKFFKVDQTTVHSFVVGKIIGLIRTI